MRRLLVLSVLGALLLGACGSSGSESASTTSTTATPDRAVARRLARAALLRPSDAPGFQQVAARPSELADLPATAEDVPACAFFIEGDVHRVLTVRSLGVQRGTVVVDASVAVYPDAAAAQVEFERFRDPAMVGCLQAAYRTEGGNVDVSPIAPNDLGDDRIAYRITPSGVPDPAKAIDVIVVRVGRVVFSVNVTGTAADSAEIQSTALPKLIDRVRAAEA